MNIVILGPQGCGKGTQAEMLAEKFDLEHFDMGKSLRRVAEEDTPLGKEIWEIQNVSRTLVPKRIMQEVFALKMNSIPREQGVVFDGMPRNLDQALYFEEAVREFGRKIDRIIVISITPEESVARISKRRVCEKCKKGYVFGVDVAEDDVECGVCGGKIIQRTDDTKEGVLKRLKVYHDETLPVIEHFKDKGLVSEIDGSGDENEVFDSILETILNTGD
ncbi:MAG: adenylate kinase [Candidatus Moranbacteria bacterium]|nr:adenylate kinase [Candidatus Moranbacteria bacterium]